MHVSGMSPKEWKVALTTVMLGQLLSVKERNVCDKILRREIYRIFIEFLESETMEGIEVLYKLETEREMD